MSIITVWKTNEPVAATAPVTALAAVPPWLLICWPRALVQVQLLHGKRSIRLLTMRSTGPGSRLHQPFDALLVHRLPDEAHAFGGLADEERRQPAQGQQQGDDDAQAQQARGQVGAPTEEAGEPLVGAVERAREHRGQEEALGERLDDHRQQDDGQHDEASEDAPSDQIRDHIVLELRAPAPGRKG